MSEPILKAKERIPIVTKHLIGTKVEFPYVAGCGGAKAKFLAIWSLKLRIWLKVRKVNSPKEKDKILDIMAWPGVSLKNLRINIEV